MPGSLFSSSLSSSISALSALRHLLPPEMCFRPLIPSIAVLPELDLCVEKGRSVVGTNHEGNFINLSLVDTFVKTTLYSIHIFHLFFSFRF